MRIPNRTFCFVVSNFFCSFFSVGTTNSWTFRLLSASDPGSGVAVNIASGDLCSDAKVYRQADMFFKCDPNIGTLPAKFSIGEPSPCYFEFDTLSHRCFCPNGLCQESGFDYG